MSFSRDKNEAKIKQTQSSKKCRKEKKRRVEFARERTKSRKRERVSGEVGGGDGRRRRDRRGVDDSPSLWIRTPWPRRITAVAADRETNVGKERHTPRKIESPENKVKEIKPE